jgi:fermentation-respiration switch protein FrsA (DUF1100 family)
VGSKRFIAPLLLLLISLSSCSGLLYHPTRQLHFEPSRFGVTPEEVVFLSADSTKLMGWWFRGEKPKAVFLLYHGNGGNLSSHYVNMLWALRKNYDLFVFDYRGFGRSEGSPSPGGTVEDGEAALRWLYSQYPSTPIILIGQSLGGAIALRNAIDLKNEIPFRAVVIDSSFPSYQGIGRDVLSRFWLTWPFQWVAYLVLSDHYAPDGDINKLAPVPLLVIHHELDRVVPLSQGEKIFWQAAEPRELWKVPGEGHINSFLQENGAYTRKLDEWLRDKIKRRK